MSKLKFDFWLHNAAMNNGPAAKAREATRMACLAHGLTSLGHDVRILGPGPLPHSRHKYFAKLFGPRRPDALQVRTMEELGRRQTADVAVKCTVKAKWEARRQHCRILVAHEASPELTGSEGVVDVPFLVHDDVIAELINRGLFDAYLQDDLDKIRSAFDFTKTIWTGFRGTGWSNRVAYFSGCPDWVDVKFHPMGQPSLAAWTHCAWLASMRASPALAGDTPKTNLPPTLAMLGVPIFAPSPEANKISLDSDSFILHPGGSDPDVWTQLRNVLSDEARLKEIADRATLVYKAGWSPIGQAKLIAEACGA